LFFDTHVPALGETFLIQDNQIITQGLIKDENKEAQLNEIARSINKIKHKFSLLLTDIEFSGVELEQENLFYKVKGQLDQLQHDIKKVKRLIKQNELEV